MTDRLTIHNNNFVEDVPPKKQKLRHENKNGSITTTQTRNNVEQQQQQNLWSIQDTLFHPLGLLNHGTSQKSVVLTWSDDYLLNFLIKKSKNDERIRLRSLKIHLPKGEKVLAILILELNTLLLMESGKVYYFVSGKIVEEISWLSGVRCISKAKFGFSVLRVNQNKRLYLEVYKDTIAVGQMAPIVLHRFDITFDELNIFNCDWKNDEFTLLSYTVRDIDNQLVFMKEVIGRICDLRDQQEIHFFTVSGNLFALINDVNDDDGTIENYQIQLLNTYASSIELLKILTSSKFFFVILKCGTLEIWYMSPIAKALLRKQHHTGTHFISYDFCEADNCFFYTDLEKVVQIKFRQYDGSDTCYFVEKFKPIPGILVCSWVTNMKRLICLCCNNIVHQLDFNGDTTIIDTANNTTSIEMEYESLYDLYELTSRKIDNLMKKAKVIKELDKAPLKVLEEVNSEFSKHQLLAASRKSKFLQKLFKAELKFYQYLPPQTPQDAVMFYAGNLQLAPNECFYAIISLTIKRNVIFNAALWNLYLDFSGLTQIFCVLQELLHQNFYIIVPLYKNSKKPYINFNLRMLTFVEHAGHFMAITFPIEITKPSATYMDLFSSTTRSITISSDYTIEDLVQRFTRQRIINNNFSDKVEGHHIIIQQYNLSLPKGFEVNKVQEIFTGIDAIKSRNIDGDELNLRLYFMTDDLDISYKKSQHGISIKSESPMALFYAKMHLFQNLINFELSDSQQQGGSDGDNDDENKRIVGSNMPTTILHNQSHVERLYGTLLQNELANVVKNSISPNIPIEYLQKIYTKIREEIMRNK